VLSQPRDAERGPGASSSKLKRLSHRLPGASSARCRHGDTHGAVRAPADASPSREATVAGANGTPARRSCGSHSAIGRPATAARSSAAMEASRARCANVRSRARVSPHASHSDAHMRSSPQMLSDRSLPSAVVNSP
jgi:hypothetical protein